jgi:hypothetical protein
MDFEMLSAYRKPPVYEPEVFYKLTDTVLPVFPFKALSLHEH